MRNGFTLIEVLAVVALLALLGTVAGVSLQGAAARASLDEIADRIVAYDAGARTYAARYGRQVALQWTGQGVSQRLADSDAPLAARESLRLPGDYRLRVHGNEGEAEVAISTAGASRTYVVQVTAPTGHARWVLFAGLTGEAILFENETDLDVAMAALDAADEEVQ